jgi:hypothetical protein
MSASQGQASSSSDRGSEAYESSHEHVPEDWYEAIRHDDDDDDDDDDEDEDEEDDPDYVEDDEFMDAEGGDVELELVLEAEVAHGGAHGDDEGDGEEDSAIYEAEQSLHRRILRLISGGEFFPGHLPGRDVRLTPFRDRHQWSKLPYPPPTPRSPAWT